MTAPGPPRLPFPAMIPPIARPLLALMIVATASQVNAQLPLMTAPKGTLRIEFGGGFFPTDEEFADGKRRPLGGSLTSSALGAAGVAPVADLDQRMAQLLGRPATPGSLGGVTAILERQRGVGTIGLGWGISRRLTLATRVPIVSTRTQARLTQDGTGANLGINPADQFPGEGGGSQQNAAFLAEFTAALDQLASRTAAGDFAGDPTLEALAQQTLSEAPAFRDGLATLLGSAPLLPAIGTTDGDALLAATAAFRTRFADQFGISGFTAAPALPSSTLTPAGFQSLLSSPSGFGLLPFGEDPRVQVGDIEVELTAELWRTGQPGDARWLALWGRGGVALPTGSAPRPDALLDQGSGDGQFDLLAGAVLEAGRDRLGVRVAVDYRRQFADDLDARVGARDALLRLASSEASLRRDPGDVIQLAAQPYFRLAPHFAIVGSARWWSRGTDRWSWSSGQTALPGLDPTVMNAGTKGSATLLGIGVSYVHDGPLRDGRVGMPVEASFGIERLVSSGRGLVDAPLITRLTFRIYKSLIGRPPAP